MTPDFADDGYWDKVFKFMKAQGVEKFSYNGLSAEFKTETAPVGEGRVHTVDLATGMPPNDEMLFYATDEFDRIRAEREAAINPPQE